MAGGQIRAHPAQVDGLAYATVAGVMVIRARALSPLDPSSESELWHDGPTARPLGVGTWQWGDRLYWNWGEGYGEADARAVFDRSRALGISLFDTAEVYGFGESERLLGRFLHAAGRRDGTIVATKFAPLPWRVRARAVQRALESSRGRLGVASVDLYQLHWPMPFPRLERCLDGLADVSASGMARAVGVSNCDLSRTRRAHAHLQRGGVQLATNQVEFSLLTRWPERTGLLDACRALGVRVIAYSPLAQGILSGKYGPGRLPAGGRGRRYARAIERAQPLLSVLREVAAGRDRTPAQVALNWVICKGAIPIPGAKTASQAEANAGALGWRLTEDEVARLDRASDEVAPAGIGGRFRPWMPKST